MRTTVAIVGGGLAGLYAARLLQIAGIEFQLLEAKHRFGGRILSVNGKGEPSSDGFDLGPSWFWPAIHPNMARVVEGLGLRTFYDRPFWRESGLSGTAQSGLGPLTEIHDATLASGPAALFGFVGLDRRQRMAVGEEALVRAAIAQLGRLFGPKAGQTQATLFKDWTADAFTATEADTQAGGHPAPDPRPWISGGWAPYISLAGSETSATDPGYLAGALDAAARAVAEAVSRL